jgi:hypothetical protein
VNKIQVTFWCGDVTSNSWVVIDNHMRKTDGEYKNNASINTASESKQCEHGCVTGPILHLQDKSRK